MTISYLNVGVIEQGVTKRWFPKDGVRRADRLTPL